MALLSGYMPQSNLGGLAALRGGTMDALPASAAAIAQQTIQTRLALAQLAAEKEQQRRAAIANVANQMIATREAQMQRALHERLAGARMGEDRRQFDANRLLAERELDAKRQDSADELGLRRAMLEESALARISRETAEQNELASREGIAAMQANARGEGRKSSEQNLMDAIMSKYGGPDGNMVTALIAAQNDPQFAPIMRGMLNISQSETGTEIPSEDKAVIDAFDKETEVLFGELANNRGTKKEEATRQKLRNVLSQAYSAVQSPRAKAKISALQRAVGEPTSQPAQTSGDGLLGFLRRSSNRITTPSTEERSLQNGSLAPMLEHNYDQFAPPPTVTPRVVELLNAIQAASQPARRFAPSSQPYRR